MKKIFALLFCAFAVAFVSCKNDKTEDVVLQFDTPVVSAVSGTAATVTCKLLNSAQVGSIPVGFAYGLSSEPIDDYQLIKNPVVHGNTFSCRLLGLLPKTDYKVVAFIQIGQERTLSALTSFKTQDVLPGETVLEITSLTTINASSDPDMYVISYQVVNDQANTDATAESDKTWVHSFDYSSRKEITFDVDSNTGAERRAVITVSYPGATSREVTVVQQAFAPPVSGEPTFTAPTYSNLTSSSATINGSFDYSGDKTISKAYFLYTAATGTSQQASVTVAPGAKSVQLSGLTPSTAYTFGLCVEIDGNVYSSTQSSFTTTGNTPPPTPGDTKFSGWPELPVEVTNSDYHYAYHICPSFKVGGHLARNFTVCYSAEYHCPVWVAAPLHDCYVGGSGNRNYGPDPVIPSGIQPSSKTVSSPYNKGHMLGNRERSRDSGMNKQVSYYTNMAPQHATTFNTGGGAWNNLEDYIDGHWCNDTLYMVSGCHFQTWTDSYGNTASPRRIGFGGKQAGVPTMFYYVLLRTKNGNTGKSVINCSASELKCVGFVMSHAMPKGHRPDPKDMRSVKWVEDFTGFKFFTNVPNAPKETYNASDWGL